MKKYNVIYTDPPWQYDNKKTGGSLVSGASAKYQTMSTAEICALNVPGICEKNAVCFMWATVPMIQDAFKVLSAWGFKYKTMIIWHKEGAPGMGYWLRGSVELLLVGVKGQVKASRVQKINVRTEKKGKHSEKPISFRDLASTMMVKSFEGVEIKGLEMFARKEVKSIYDCCNWDYHGNEIKNSIVINERAVKS